MSNFNKSALTDRASPIIDWEGEEIINKEPKTNTGSHLDQKDIYTNEQSRGQLRATHVYDDVICHYPG